MLLSSDNRPVLYWLTYVDGKRLAHSTIYLLALCLALLSRMTCDLVVRLRFIYVDGKRLAHSTTYLLALCLLCDFHSPISTLALYQP